MRHAGCYVSDIRKRLTLNLKFNLRSSRYPATTLHDITTQKTLTFTTVRTSNLTFQFTEWLGGYSFIHSGDSDHHSCNMYAKVLNSTELYNVNHSVLKVDPLYLCFILFILILTKLEKHTPLWEFLPLEHIAVRKLSYYIYSADKHNQTMSEICTLGDENVTRQTWLNQVHWLCSAEWYVTIMVKWEQ
jgi:hypothetical protein